MKYLTGQTWIALERNSVQFDSIQFNLFQFSSVKFNSVQFSSFQFSHKALWPYDILLKSEY